MRDTDEVGIIIEPHDDDDLVIDGTHTWIKVKFREEWW